MIDNSKEYILCSAILRIKEKPVTSLIYTDIHKVECGFRHCDIFQKFKGEVRRDPDAQGFLTSKGLFKNRKEAEIIARNCGQITGRLIGGELTSEDLW